MFVFLEVTRIGQVGPVALKLGLLPLADFFGVLRGPFKKCLRPHVGRLVVAVTLPVLAPYFGTKMYYDLVADGFELDKKPWEYFFHQTGELMVNNTISPLN